LKKKNRIRSQIDQNCIILGTKDEFATSC